MFATRELWCKMSRISDGRDKMCFILGWGRGTSKHSCIVSYLLCWRRHVSADVVHLQVTKCL